MRIAITHQHSLQLGGSERVLEVLAQMYPTADFFCMVADPKAIPKALRGRNIQCSFLNRVPGAKRFYSYFLPACPLAVEALDLSGYDLVISADGSHTLGVLTDQQTIHLCYCHSPHRSLWDMYPSSMRQMPRPVRPIFALSAQYARQWMFSAAQRIDFFAANSSYVAQRIRKYFRRESTVIHPPVETDDGYIASHRDSYFLSVGRLARSKRVDLLIEACNSLGRPLVIAGTGPEEKYLKSISGSTVEFAGRVPDAELSRLYAHCRAFLFASDEDFGIAPVEAQAFGRPVVAYGHGGSLETVIGYGAPNSTGVFFSEQTERSIADGIRHFEAVEEDFDPAVIRRHAQKFSTPRFKEQMNSFVNSALSSNTGRSGRGNCQSARVEVLSDAAI